MSAAPTADAMRPATVTPPDAPGAVGRIVRIDRGCVCERDPISVAHVSAVAVDTAPPNPAKSNERLCSGANEDAKARAAATPPFAMTCTASRSLPRRCSRSAVPGRRPSSVDEMKNATSIAPPRNPDPATTAAPTPVAAKVPSGDSAPARRAISEIAAAPARPNVTRARNPLIIVHLLSVSISEAEAAMFADVHDTGTLGENGGARRGPLAQRQSSGLLIHWFRVRIPGGPPGRSRVIKPTATVVQSLAPGHCPSLKTVLATIAFFTTRAPRDLVLTRIELRP